MNEQTNFELAIETIRKGMREILPPDYPKDDKALLAVSSFLLNAEDAYILVQWPESQNLMGEDWFQEEACLDVNNEIGSSYFIPLKRLL